MRKLSSINRHSVPGFYASASRGEPRFLVLPEGRDGLAAVQLDHTAKRRAFTLIKLTSQAVGKGNCIEDVMIVTPLHKGRFKPSECPIGAIVVNDNALSFQFVNESGVVMLVEISNLTDDQRSRKFPSKGLLRWEILDMRDVDAPALFQSHPRLSEADPIDAAGSNSASQL